MARKRQRYECAFVQIEITRGPMEKPSARVLHHEIEILRAMYGEGSVRIVPTDEQAGGDLRRMVRAGAEYMRLAQRYGNRGEGDSAISWVEYVYGRPGSREWLAALEDAEAYEIEISTLAEDPADEEDEVEAEAPSEVTKEETPNDRQTKRERKRLVLARLDELGIEHDGRMGVEDLESLLPEGEEI